MITLRLYEIEFCFFILALYLNESYVISTIQKILFITLFLLSTIFIHLFYGVKMTSIIERAAKPIKKRVLRLRREKAIGLYCDVRRLRGYLNDLQVVQGLDAPADSKYK